MRRFTGSTRPLSGCGAGSRPAASGAPIPSLRYLFWKPCTSRFIVGTNEVMVRPREGQAGLIDHHIHGAERHVVTAALQFCDALGARTAEYLGQCEIVEVRRMQELRGVWARTVGVAGRKQHRICVERRSQQHRLGFGAAAV